MDPKAKTSKTTCRLGAIFEKIRNLNKTRNFVRVLPQENWLFFQKIFWAQNISWARATTPGTLWKQCDSLRTPNCKELWGSSGPSICTVIYSGICLFPFFSKMAPKRQVVLLDFVPGLEVSSSGYEFWHNRYFFLFIVWSSNLVCNSFSTVANCANLCPAVHVHHMLREKM